jgi:nicotinamide-nucleotide amidase
VRAAILSIGDELTTGQTREGNAAWLAAQLAARAVTTVELRVVPDKRAAIAGAIRELASRCDVLLATGGIGPTADDLTRQGLGAVLAPGQSLATDAEALANLERHWTRRSARMPPANIIQAQHPPGARLLPNPRGTAPGIAGSIGYCRVYIMPGPPREMRKMFRDHVLPELSNSSELVRLTALVHEFGLGESAAEERLGDITDRDRRPRVGITHSDATVTARIQAQGTTRQAETQVEQVRGRIVELWAPYAFGIHEVTLADATLKLLRERGRTLATAESCTGGLLGKLAVDVAGSSECYVGGWVTYSNKLKTTCLGVDPDLIAEHGAVSTQTATAMAIGALDASGADESLAITGVAGPGGGTVRTTVGTVFVALARRHDDAVEVAVRHFRFPGDRAGVRDRAAMSALQMLRFALLGTDAPLLWEVLPEGDRG